MKTILKTTLVTFLLIAFSCSKDDAPEQEQQQVNEAPTTVILTGPANSALNVDVKPSFTWQAATDSNGDTITYQVYADTNVNPTTLIGSTTNTHLDMDERLLLLQAYNWKVVASDGRGGESQSEVQSFRTRSIISSIVSNTAPFGNRRLHGSVVFNDKLWVIGGQLNGGTLKNDVWNSNDGINWNLVTANAAFTPRRNIYTIVFNNKIWAIGGYDSDTLNNDVWNSDDGITWNLVTSDAGFFGVNDLIIFNNKMFVTTGNKIWSSDDGAIWSFIIDLPTNANTFFVFEDKLWAAYDFEDDYYVNEDGLNWSFVETSLNGQESFLFGTFHDDIVVFNNQILGLNRIGTTIMHSTDAITWNAENHTSSVLPDGLYYYSTEIFNDKIWIIGGQSTGTTSGSVKYIE